jgi:hypothetical protein
MESATGATVGEAFANAVEQALYEYGHRGYTGSLAEKHDYIVIPLDGEATKDAAVAAARKLMHDDDARISDKWGPAGAIRYADFDEPDQQHWLFFGWASS